MFDDKTSTNQSSAPADEVIQPHSSQANSTVPNSNVVPASFKPIHPKKEDQEPEDIFGNSDPVEPSIQAQTTPVNIQENTPVSTDQSVNKTLSDEPADSSSEPAIKNTPSVFKKLTNTVPATTPDNTSSPMPTTTAPVSKKNIVILIILILVILVF
jgi:hypothetical protein